MKASTEQDYRERIVRTAVYIQEHLDQDLRGVSQGVCRHGMVPDSSSR
jgi:hypothetical protein